jgi:peptidoglycan/LPS O-acetylase OafA/YrhL
MSFDLMRLIAALLVVVSHTFPLSGAPALRISGVEDLGALGVSIFFVISGFLVSASYQRDPKTYLFKRILRIEPGLIASLLVTVVALGFMTTAPAAVYWPKAAEYVARNALLFPTLYELPGVLQAAPVAGVVNGVLWTLQLEFTFYVVLMPIRARLPLVLGLCVLCAGAWLTVAVAWPDWGHERATRIAFLAGRNGFLFFAGAALQLVRARIPVWAAAVAAVAAAAPLVGPLALPVAIIGLARPGKLPADLSYGIYIYAFPVQQVLASYGQLNLMTAVLAVLPFAAASWFLVEKPALKLKPGPRPDW